ncbi:hypothetical protein SUBVAR_04316 [Subdoligranulum variabile DSM 15176]|uniref:Uncharacterized protein n=1 Tax=Subdoligranulum variabile DSM 15176 TaxID=411471 RepID=D1PIZ8_9FIRM|nr:hypothetical protein SUBVAR_06615 [Subdoligranulum variabile DSM 15176]EFB75103.1 hypothetical protein SUBVAR_06590 [Subdoligranulum variabile DSM 15176]EFB77507.1 hypothetical protein SUBVAR_04316 [Subdoligranulum variabile DSM 15176]
MPWKDPDSLIAAWRPNSILLAYAGVPTDLCFAIPFLNYLFSPPPFIFGVDF